MNARRICAVTTAVVGLAAAPPAIAEATVITVGDPSGTSPPAGATPGSQAEIGRGTATTDPGCTYQVSEP